MAKLTETVSDISNKVAQIEDGKFSEPMIRAIKDVQNQNPQSYADAVHKDTVIKLVETQTNEKIAEAEDRAKRQTNLIIFNVPETQADDDKGKKDDDVKSVRQILQEIQSTNQAADVRRLNGKNKQTTRPVRVSFHSQVARDEVLRSFSTARRREVKDAEDNDPRLCSKVIMRKDMTPKEREDDLRLYKELKTKQEDSKASGDQYAKWARRNGKIINLGKYPNPSMAEDAGETM